MKYCNSPFKYKIESIISSESDTSGKCRCCTNPSVNFIKLETSIKTSEGLEKTYRDLLYEITNFQIPVYQEHVMPQKICHKCSQQLKSSYKFFQQACQVSRQYLQMAYEQPTSPLDVKNIEHLEESLIEINESIYDSKLEEKIEVEPLIIEECNAEIKQEIEDNELLIEGNLPKEEYPEYSISENPSSTFPLEDDDHDDSEEPESLNGNEDFLANEPLARRCDICQKVYRNKKFLNNHMRYTHMPEEDKMPCPLCSYRANRSWSLRIHVGLAHGQDKVLEYFKPVPKSKKIHPCSYCSRSYAHKETLRQHIKTKHLNKPSIKQEPSETKPAKPKKSFLCTYCGQAFNWKHGLESHILTHTDERPFSCDICSKTFKRHKDLQLHRVIHSDEKPHQCTECGKAFKRVDKLKTHIKIVHSDLRPYKCSECEQSFKYQNVLRAHMNIHTGHTLTKPVGKHFRGELQ